MTAMMLVMVMIMPEMAGDSSDDAGNESAGENGVGSDSAAPDSAGSYGDIDGNINKPQ